QVGSSGGEFGGGRRSGTARAFTAGDRAAGGGEGGNSLPRLSVHAAGDGVDVPGSGTQRRRLVSRGGGQAAGVPGGATGRDGAGREFRRSGDRSLLQGAQAIAGTFDIPAGQRDGPAVAWPLSVGSAVGRQKSESCRWNYV